MREDSDKIDMEGFQEMLRKRRAPTPKKTFSGNKGGGYGGSDEPPAWLVNNQMRWSDFRKEEGLTTRIRVFPKANGDIFHEYQSCWVNGRTIISNAWNGERPLPCLLFDKYSKAYEDGGYEMAKNFRSSTKYAMSTVLLHWFYEQPKEVNGRTYYNYHRVPAPGPHGASENPQYANCDKTFGRVKYFDFYTGQKDDFEKQLRDVSTTCLNCKEGIVTEVAFSCEGCGNVFGDLRETRIPHSELEFLRSGKTLACEECGHTAPPKIEYQCSEFKGYDGATPVYEKGCDNPIKVDLTQPFDLVVKTSKIGGKWAYEIKDISAAQDISELPDRQSNPSLGMGEPMDFDRFLSRIDLESQAKALGVDNPYDRDVESLIDQYFAAAADEEDHDSIPF